MLDMVFPTDLAVLPDGGVGVLDSYAEKVIVLDDDLNVVREVPGPAWGSLVRGALSTEPGSWWSVSPEDAFVLKLDTNGNILATFGTSNFREEVDVHPVAVADLGEEIVVGTREGELLWLDATTGSYLRRLRTDVDGARLGSIADIAVWPWTRRPERQGVERGDYPNFTRWFAEIETRPAVQRGVQVLAEHQSSGTLSDEARRNMFGDAQYARR